MGMTFSLFAGILFISPVGAVCLLLGAGVFLT